MPIYGIESLDSISAGLSQKLHAFADEAQGVLQREADVSAAQASEDIAIYQREKITEGFNSAVDRFYGDYSPSYVRRGDVNTQTGGLYAAFTYLTDTEGWVQYNSIEDFYDGANMDISFSPKRQYSTNTPALREYLFNQAFVQGWHGGADKIDGAKALMWGAHPASGTPYYRQPGFARSKDGSRRVWHKWGSWGQKAFKSAVAPHTRFADFMASFESTEEREYQAMVDARMEEAVNRTSEQMPSLMAKYFG